MSGNQCADFGGANLGPNLCSMPAGHAYEGLITYRDGRVAVLRSSEGGNSVFAGPNGTGDITLADLGASAVALTRTLQGAEIGDCFGGGTGRVSLFPLLTAHDGAAVTWEASHLAALYRAMGQSGGQSGNAFFCSNRENARTLVVNNDAFHRGTLLTAIDALGNARSSYSTLDDTHYDTLLRSLRAAAGVATHEPGFLERNGSIIGLVMGVAVLLAFGTHGYKAWIDLFRKGPPDDPSGGSGGGGGIEDAFARGLAAGLRLAAGASIPEPAADPAPAANPGTAPGTPTARIVASGLDAARAIIRLNGGNTAVAPGAPGTVPNVGWPGLNPTLFPVPAPGPMPVPPVVAPAPVLVPRLVPVP